MEIIALGFPQIAFKFKDDYQFIQTCGSGNCINTFRQLFGQSLLESPTIINDKESDISISGFVSKELLNSKYHQYLYINHRFISGNSVIHNQIDARNKNGNFSVFVLYITMPWNLVTLLKEDCYSYEMKLLKSSLDDDLSRLISRSLGICIDTDNVSVKITQKKRRINTSSIRSSKNIDYDSMFQKNNSPFQLSVCIFF